MTHKPRKRFGQHFLTDVTIIHQIHAAIRPSADEHLVEIGPGEGVMTDHLIPQCKRLDLIEIDRDLVRHLAQKTHHAPHVHIHCCDVLSFDLAALVSEQAKLRIVGNLPYNISTPLLFHLFKTVNVIEDMHFMLQKEVIDRMTATVGDPLYNRLSVMTQYFCDNTTLFYIPPTAFHPPPKVDSAFIRMQPVKRAVFAQCLDTLETVVRTAFTQRRKTIQNGLKGLLTAKDFTAVNVDPGARPQQCSVDDFVKISNLLYDRQ